MGAEIRPLFGLEFAGGSAQACTYAIPRNPRSPGAQAG